MDIAPVVLDGPHVRLEPLDLERHFEGLRVIGLDPDLWRWGLQVIETAPELRRYLQAALREQEEGRSLPFATILQEGERVAGCTRFGNIERAHRRVEIGWTWVGVPYQRTVVNTEAKYLMMRHAFEVWGCNRVELKTNALNRRSRTAIARIGAREEGILRKHAISESGVPRDTIYFSVIDEEWPQVKARLEGMLGLAARSRRR